MIVIIDYGMGNVGSIFNMLKKVGSRQTYHVTLPRSWKRPSSFSRALAPSMKP